MNENHEALDYLLTNFVEVRDLINVVNHDGRTALRYAVREGSVDCVKTLLLFGARVG
jgi:ankyrin repeat protein